MPRLIRSPRLRAALAAMLAATLLGAAPAPRDPSRLVVLSTTDVKGKTSPCGCHTPKGGFARRATYVDSVRAVNDQVLLVDGGGFFPETDAQRDAGPFELEAMQRLGTAAAGIGERDLRFGLAFLRENARRARMPLTCANLLERTSRRPAFAPSVIVNVGAVPVGIFGLITDQGDLGPARDTLLVTEPEAAARQTVAELRKKGATVIVLLSQLGKVESEDIATAVEGIDVVVAGRNVPLIQRGRLIKHSVVAYGGDQGWYVGRSVLTLDATHHVTTGDNDMDILGPDVPGEPAMLARVKTFEDALNERLRVEEKERAAAAAMRTPGSDPTEDEPDHFVGAEVCGRCHGLEYRQWQTTPHAHAWQALVDARKDATPECVKCHVVGYQQVGGFHSGDDAGRLGNVQCENCHGMGTQHDSFRAVAAKVEEPTCRSCHDATSSPTFDFALYQPHVLHHPVADLKPIPESPAKRLMRGGSR